MSLPSFVLRRLGAIAVLLMGLAACVENFERVTTTVTWDPATRTYAVQRVLHNLSAKFFGCNDAATCVTMADAMVRLDYASHTPKSDFTSLLSASEEEREAMAKNMASNLMNQGDQPTWTRMAKALVDSKAYDIKVRYLKDGDKLDALITYRATVDATAATETGVVLETVRKGKKRFEYLVVDAGKDSGGFKSETPPRLLDAKYTERTHAGSSPKIWWVLPAATRTVTIERFVDETAQPILGAVNGLEEALRQAGLLGGGA